MRERLKLTEERIREGVTVIRAGGQLDAQSTPELVKRCQALAGPGVHVILNLSQVGFISSSGVGGLLGLVEGFNDAGGQLHLVELSVPVSSVLKLLNLDRFLPLGGSVTDVLKDIAA